MVNLNLEKQYKKLIIRHIAEIQACPERRAALFLDFHENGDDYYDRLCDLLFSVSTGETRTLLWLNPCGEIYSGLKQKAAHHIFLLDTKDLPAFNGDLLEALDCVFTRIYSLTTSNNRRHLCKASL